MRAMPGWNSCRCAARRPQDPGGHVSHPFGKILVLGHHHRIMFVGMTPYQGVFALGKADFKNVLRLMPLRAQPSGKSIGKLRVNEEAHNSCIYQH